MNNIGNAIKLAAGLILFSVLTSACQKTLFPSNRQIRFRVVSGTGTKTSYSGEITDNVERIDWSENDLIRIYCEAAGHPDCKYSDYTVLENSISKDGAISQAYISTTGEGLRWGDGGSSHIFYAVYPSPATSGHESDEIGDGFLTGTIPSQQAPLAIKDNVVVPDLTSEYMVATTEIPAGVSSLPDGVFLNFVPISTSIEFTIKNGTSSDEELSITGASLFSDGIPVSGDFSADLASLMIPGTKFPACSVPEYGGVSNYVTIPFGKSIVLERDEDLKFTFFLHPSQNISGLTLKLTRSDGATLACRLSYEDGTSLTFPRCKKSFVKGMLIPSGIKWTGFSVVPWDSEDKPFEMNDGNKPGQIENPSRDTNEWTF